MYRPPKKVLIIFFFHMYNAKSMWSQNPQPSILILAAKQNRLRESSKKTLTYFSSFNSINQSMTFELNGYAIEQLLSHQDISTFITAFEVLVIHYQNFSAVRH